MAAAAKAAASCGAAWQGGHRRRSTDSSTSMTPEQLQRAAGTAWGLTQVLLAPNAYMIDFKVAGLLGCFVF